MTDPFLVDGNSSGCLKTVCDYVHLNPVGAALVRPGQPLESCRWSSYRGVLASRRHKWLRVDRLLGERRIPQDGVAGRRRFGRFFNQRRTTERPANG